jgi:hypothetical protein
MIMALGDSCGIVATGVRKELEEADSKDDGMAETLVSLP